MAAVATSDDSTQPPQHLAREPPPSYTAASSLPKLNAMIRLIFWIALIFAALWLWRKFNSAARPGRPSAQDDIRPMVRCAHCGLHLPQNHALRHEGLWYCGQPHLEQGPSARER